MPGTRVAARPVLDELVGTDGSVVLVEVSGGHRVVRLSRLGETVRRRCSRGVELDDLVEQVSAELGPAPGADARELVIEAVRSLVAGGLLDTSGPAL